MSGQDQAAVCLRRASETEAGARSRCVSSNNSNDGSDSDLDVEKGAAQLAYAAEHGDESAALLGTTPSKTRSNSTSVINLNAVAGGAAAASYETTRLDVLKSVVAISVWYSSNIGLLMLNKYMLSGFGFRRPVFLTLWHMVACTLLSGAIAAAGLVPSQHITSARQFGKVAVLALVFCGSVVAGNVSLKYIPVSFSQAIGATTPLFTAFLSLVFLAQRETRRVYMTLIPVVMGIVIATGAEPSFHMLGFLAAVFATAARAFKSILQGLLLTDSSEKLDSMNLLRFMTPIASAALMVLVAVLEPDIGNSLPRVGDPKWITFYSILGFNGFLAFLVNLTNFLVTRYTSALTLQVLGNAKGLIAVCISILIFQNPWNSSSMGGYGMAAAGVAWFMHEKRKAKAAVQPAGTARRH